MERFLKAHQSDYLRALSEVRAGEKTSHWMWYIFPQLRGLGFSEMARYYGIAGEKEAAEYMSEPTLRAHMLELCEALLKLETNDARAVFGDIDAKKLRSSMTLFTETAPEYDVFSRVLQKFYGGKEDPKTLELLGK